MKQFNSIAILSLLALLVFAPVLAFAQQNFINDGNRAYGVQRTFDSNNEGVPSFTRGATIENADAGGLLYVNTADSTAVTAASGDASTDETAYDVSYTIPADTLAAGDTVRVQGAITVTGSHTTAGNITVKVKLDGQIIFSSGTLTMDDAVGGAGDASEFVSWDMTVGIRSTTAGLVTGEGKHDVGDSQAVTLLGSASSSLSSIDTTGTMAVTVTVQYGTENAANTSTLKQLAVYRNA